MNRIFLIMILIFPPVSASGAMIIKIIKSTTGELIIHADIEINSEDDLRPTTVLVGLPGNYLPVLSISYGSPVIHNFRLEQDIIETGWSGKQVLNGLETASLTISPRAAGNKAFTELTISIIFPPFTGRNYSPDQQQERLLAARVINWPAARSWMTFQEQSLFKSSEQPAGRWFKFKTDTDGMTKITGKTILAALNTDENIDSRSLHLYTGSALGRDRTYDLTMFNISSQDFYPNLIEIPFELRAEKKELLQDGDEIWFWAQGASGFDQKNGEISWHQNLYFNYNTYWLLLPHDPGQKGERIKIAENNISTALNFDYGLEYVHFEEDNINPYNSGLGWGNTKISAAAAFSRPVDLVQPVEALKISGSAAFLGFEGVPTRFNNTKHSIQMAAGGVNISTANWSNLGQKILNFSFSLSSIPDNFQAFEFSNISNNPNSNPYFDYLSFSYGRKLSLDENPFDFFAPLKGNDISFTITGSNPLVWNITNPEQPLIIPVENAADISIVSVSLDPDLYSRFSIFKADQLIEVLELIFIGEKNFNEIKNAVENISQLIIGPAEFEAAAGPLINHRKKTRYIPLELIYDEFSGGNADPAAIREFIKWTQEKWPKPAPFCALLMGDGDYDYRNISGLSNIKVPTIEVGIVNSFPSDDRLAAIYGNIPEIALGRFPAGNTQEVSDFVEKIIKFETGQRDGSWKQRITLIADDPARPEREKHELSTGKSHTLNSERLADIIPDFMDVKKLYLVDFPESSDGSIFGVVKPEATEALIRIVRQGTSIINFIGHGNPKQWAQEQLLIINENRNDALKLKTDMKLPLWIAGTCNWGHFDQLQEDSFAEVIIRIPQDAASAVISTTRGITVSSNILYLERIFKGFFPDDGISTKTIGTVLLSTKTGGRDGELFILLGDPGMPIPIPDNLITDAEITPDTLETLEVGTITGTHPLNSSGTGILTVIDGSSPVTKYFNFFSTIEEISYEQPGPVLFRGKFDFNTNDFSTDFRIPKDISHSAKGAAGRLFLTSTNGQEALGASPGIQLTLGEPSSDVQGPIITFETEDHRILRSGDQFGENENLVIRISDPTGINITGEKGHEILLTDINSGSVHNITEGFIYDINSISTGTYIQTIEAGEKEISLKITAWDNANNPSEQNLFLSISPLNDLQFRYVLNYPNPFSESTKFTFEITQAARISVNIYTLEGRRIRSIDSQNFPVGFHFINWNGKDKYGNNLANGVYLYRLKAENEEKTVDFIGRMAKFR